jgi:hypothetical protein
MAAEALESRFFLLSDPFLLCLISEIGHAKILSGTRLRLKRPKNILLS